MSDDESRMPDHFDRLMGSLHGLPDVVSTKPSTRRVVPPLGIGGTQTFIVQTYRQRDIGDTIFLECSSVTGTVRLVLPAAIADVIAGQRDAVTAKTRSKAAKATAADRKARGIVPGFMKKKGGGK